MADRSAATLESPPYTVVESIGSCAPLGATVVAGGVNFSVFSRSASAVEVLFFDHADDPRPARDKGLPHPLNPRWGPRDHPAPTRVV